MPRSEPRLAADGGNARTPTEPPGRPAAPEQGLDSGDELRGLRVDDDVTAEQHPADHLLGDWDATWRLAELLMKQGRGEEAERSRRIGLNPDGSIAFYVRACLKT